MNVILSTRNPSKLLQIKALFDGSPITLQTLDDVGISGEAIEDGLTLEENAFKKAGFASEHAPGSWTMADDTGIFIHALDGAPGVHSARWAGNVSTEEIMHHTLNKLVGVDNRSATFKTVVAVLSPAGEPYLFVGEVHGKLLEAPRTTPHPKMPYSPLFVPEGETQCWAEMETEYENAISHRGKAFRKARAFFEAL